MKNLSSVLSVISFICVCVLFGLYFKDKKSGSATRINNVASTTTPPSGKIAYVDMDSLELKYDFFKVKNDEFKRKEEAIKSELDMAYQKMVAYSNEMQEKQKAGTLTEADGVAAGKKIEDMKESFLTRKQTLSDQLQKAQEEFAKYIKNRLDSFLTVYNKDKGYDFILSVSQGTTILYENKALNITNDVAKGLNEMSKSELEDMTKKK